MFLRYLKALLVVWSLFLPSLLYSQGELLELADKYRSLKKFNLALDILRGLKESHPHGEIYIRALILEGDIYLDMGDTARARNDYLKAINENLGDSLGFIAYRKLSNTYSDNAKKGDVLYKFLLNYPLSSYSDSAFREALGYFKASGSIENELKLLKFMSFIHPDSREQYIRKIARLWGQNGHPERGLKLLKRVFEEGDTFHLYKSEIFLFAGDTGKAILELRKCSLPECYGKLFDLYLDLGFFCEAESLISRLPMNEYLKTRLLKFYLLREDTFKVRELLSEGDIGDTLLLLRAYFCLNETDSLLNLHFDSLSPELGNILVRTYLKRGEIVKAYRLLMKLESAPLCSLRLEVAKTLLRRGLYTLVEELLKGGKRCFPRESWDRMFYSLALFTSDTGVADSLEEVFKKRGIDVTPIFPIDSILKIYTNLSDSSRYRVASTLFNMGAYEDVVELLYKKRLLVKEALVLANALTKLFIEEGDTSYAVRALYIYDHMDKKPPSYFLLMSRFKPEEAVIKNFDVGEFGEAELRSLIYLLSLKGRDDLALPLIPYARNRELALFEYHLGKGNLDSAFKYLDTGNLYDIFRLADAYRKRGAKDEAVGLYSYIPEDNSRLSLLARRGEAYILFDSGDYERFIPIAEKILPYLRGALREDMERKLAVAYYKAGKTGKTLLLVWKKDDEIALKLKALSLIALNELDRALEVPVKDPLIKRRVLIKLGKFSQVIEDSPPETRLEGLYFLDRVMESPARDSLPLYLKKLSKSRVIEPLDVYLYMLRYYLIKDSLERAMYYFKNLTSEHLMVASYYIGLHLMKKGKNNEAKAHFYRAIESSNDSIRGLAAFKLASILFAEGKYRDAAEFYRIASNLLDGVHKVQALYNRAIAFKKAKEIDSSVAIFKKIIGEFQGFKESDEATLSLALIYEDLGKWDSALVYLRSLMGEMPSLREEAERAYWEAEAFLNKNDLKSALNLYLVLFYRYLNAGDWGVTAGLKGAKILTLLGKKSEALNVLQKIVDIRGEGDPLGKVALEELRKLKE